MYIKFKNLHIENFMSHGNSDLRLDNPGYIMLQGYNNYKDDSAVSNGSGKSGIWDALSWCLTGNTLRGAKDVINHNGDDGALVELKFSVDADEYTLIRTKEHSKYKSNLKIFKNGDEISGKTLKSSEEVLKSLLPDLTSSLLGSVIILGQGMPNKFTDNTPSGRKAILEELSKSDFMIAELKDLVGLRYKKLSADLRMYQDNKLQKETLLNNNQVRFDKAKSDLDTLHTIDISEIESEINNLIDTISEINDTISSKQNVLAYFNDIIVDLTNKKTKYVMESSEARINIANQFADEEHVLTSEISKVSTNITSVNNMIREYESIKDVCPTCGQKIPGVFKADTTKLKADLNYYNVQLVKLKEQQKMLAEKKTTDLNTALKDVQKSIQDIDNELTIQRNNINKVNKEISSLQKKLQETLVAKEKLTNTYSNYNKQVKQLTEEIKNMQDIITKLGEDIMYNTMKVDATNERLSIVKKMETYLQRDFRGALLQNVITFINEKAKVYSSQVFHTTNIEIKLDGNNIEISYNGKEYTSLSGGEQKKVDIIIQLAIRQMLITYLNFSCNCLVMDEIFDALDTLGCERITDLLMNELKDAGTVFIVSHRKDLPLATDGTVTVVKNEEGISNIIDK